jgi:hypothetical protein
MVMSDRRIGSLTESVQSLQAGDRCWFWFSEDSEALPLLIEPFSDPDGMSRLLKRAGSLPLPGGARIATGIAAVDEGGQLSFGSPLASRDMLAHLAGWVKQHVGAHPGLAGLSGARFLQVSPSGRVVTRYEDRTLWHGVPRPVREGTLEAAAEALGALEEGTDAWIWLAEGGTRPQAVALPVHTDPSAAAFSQKLLAGRRRAGIEDAGLRGTARRLRSGGLLITSSDALSAVGDRVRTWLAKLGEVRLVQVADGEIVTGERIGGEDDRGDCAAQVAALEALAGGQRVVFWFTEADRDGQPLLLLEESREALKAVAVTASSSAPSMRGQLAAAKWGVEFRTQAALPGFLPALAGWVARHHQHWPGLGVLVGARMTVRSKSGDIIERVKDNDAWALLHDTRS